MKTQKSMDNQIVMTQEGYDTLKREYEDLVNVKRPDVVKDIKQSRELGDLSENGYYHAAREKQSFIEGRIREIEDILKRVKVQNINSISKSDEVILGSRVKLEMQKQNVIFHLVDSTEVDMTQNKISHESPIGLALLGKKVGDTVEVSAPMGKIVYKIVDIN